MLACRGVIDGMISRLRVGLGTMLAVLAFSAPAYASYRDGAWGFFLVYGFASLGAAFVAVAMSTSANDPTSVLFAVIGESLLLVPVLLPAVFQYSRSQGPAATAPPSDVGQDGADLSS